jgi:hypothetical protein
MNGIITREAYLNQFVGAPERLVTLALEGGLTKLELAELLVPEKRQAFLDACAMIERRYTVECAAANDPCLEPGCAVGGEICLQPLIRNQVAYEKECSVEWATFFTDRRNRIDVWK